MFYPIFIGLSHQRRRKKRVLRRQQENPLLNRKRKKRVRRKESTPKKLTPKRGLWQLWKPPLQQSKIFLKISLSISLCLWLLSFSFLLITKSQYLIFLCGGRPIRPKPDVRITHFFTFSINKSKLTICKLDRILGTKQFFLFFWSSVFLYFWSFGHFFGDLVFYLFGPPDSV